MITISALGIAAVIITAILGYQEGKIRTNMKRDEQHAQDYMTAFMQGHEKGRAEGFKEGERKGQEKGFEDGKRYQLAVGPNEEIMREIGMIK